MFGILVGAEIQHELIIMVEKKLKTKVILEKYPMNNLCNSGRCLMKTHMVKLMQNEKMLMVSLISSTEIF